MLEWLPIETAPFDRDPQLAVIDVTGTYPLVLPCRRALYGWANTRTGAPAGVHPTHWRDRGSRVSPLSEG
jgi:hypothetical protein